LALRRLRSEDLRFIEAKMPELVVDVWSDAIRTIHLHGFTRDGLIDQTFKSSGDRSLIKQTFRIPNFPISLEVASETTGVKHGQCYARVGLRLAGFFVCLLAAGYITDNNSINWPPYVHEPMGSGPGYLNRVDGTDPAAGSEVSHSVPTNAMWELLGIRLQLTTDATVANRRVHIIIDDGSVALLDIPVGLDQTANLTYWYYLFTNAPLLTAAVGRVVNAPIPPGLRLKEGWRIRTSTTNLQAGDNWAAPRFYVKEWVVT